MILMNTNLIEKIIDTAKTYYYMLWKVILTQKTGIRNMILIFLIAMIGMLIYKLVSKAIAPLMLKLIQIVSIMFLHFFRDVFLRICVRVTGEQCTDLWVRIDHKSGELGTKVTDFFDKQRTRLKIGRLRHKKRWIIGLVVVYLWLCIPSLKVIQNMDEMYQPIFCFANNVVGSAVNAITPNIEKYPDIFTVITKAEEEQIEQEEVEIQIVLNEKGKNGANIRQNPTINSKALCVVTEEDTIFYQGQMEYDGERYWLLVSVKNGETGWLSNNLVESELLD